MSVKTLALQEKNRPKAAAPQKSTAPALVLHFDVNQDGLSPSEKKKLLDFLSNHHFTNKNKLLVVGHSCLNGPVRYNRQLSQKRAESAARIIKESTNDALSLTVEGQGESNPIYAGENLEQGRVNRRVEIHVLQ